MHLVTVEVRRLWLRRLTRILVLVGLLFAGLVTYAGYDQMRPVSASERQDAERMVADGQRDWEANGPQMVADCLTAEAEQKKVDPHADFGCDTLEPKLENFERHPATFSEAARAVPGSLMFLVPFLAFVMGASGVAAEFATGSIATWLTFVPRRLRVMSSKLAAAGLTAVPTAAITVGAALGGTYLLARGLGSLGTVTTTDWRDLSLAALRLVLAAAAAGVAGAALGALTRHTAAAVGLGVGATIVEQILSAVRDTWQPWLFTKNLEAWVVGKATYYTQTCSTSADHGYSCSMTDHTLWQGRSGLYGLLVLVVLVAVALAVFRRRDVT